jgi:hypothetical protein
VTERPGVFAHLTPVFASHPENVASEALAYILRTSPAAAGAFERFLQTITSVPGQLHFQTQFAAPTGATPDLAGLAPDGTSPVLVEVKFWAGLTENQPNGYLALLPRDRTGMLLFVVPSVRIGLLWTEVTTRAARAGWQLGVNAGSPERRLVSVSGTAVLAMTSWRSLLATLLDAVNDAGDRSAWSDLTQLQGLCDRMDAEAFLPLAPEELSGSVGTRLLQYGDLIDRTVARLTDEGIAAQKTTSGQGLWASAAAGWWGRYLALSNVVCLLRFAAAPWARDRATPIWLQVGYKSQPTVAAVLAALAPLAAEPRRVFPRQSFVDVAIDVPARTDRDDVVTVLCDQIRRVASLLAAVPRADTAAEATNAAASGNGADSAT